MLYKSNPPGDNPGETDGSTMPGGAPVADSDANTDGSTMPGGTPQPGP